MMAPGAVASAESAPLTRTVTITPGLEGFDSLGAETAAQIDCLSGQGYSFDIIDVIGDAWQGEYAAAKGAGMSVVMFQGFDPATWRDPAQGTSRGGIIATKVASVGYPKGAQIYLNLEDDIQTGTTRSELLSWVDNWAAQVSAAGYVAGVYVGVPQLLTAADLTQAHLPKVGAFWRSASASAPQVSAGYTVRQTAVSQTVCAIVNGIDVDVAARSAAGGQLVGQGFDPAAVGPTAAGAYVALAPDRILDTRKELGASGPVAPGASVSVQVAGHAGVPTAGAGAVILNITATGSTEAGDVRLYASGQPQPPTSNLNYAQGQTVANLATTQIGADGRVVLFNRSGGTVELIADVQGYTLASTPTAAGTFVPVSPSRLLDSGSPGIAPGGTATVQVAASVPAGTTAVVLNVTAASPHAAGHVSAFPAGGTASVSDLNFVAGQTTANLVVAKLGTGGAVALVNASTGSTRLIADLQGYLVGGVPAEAGAIAAVAPSRLLDTRSSKAPLPTGPVAGHSAIALDVTGVGGVPAVGVSAVALNITVTGATSPGYLTVFASGRTAPGSSNLNFAAGQDVPGLVLAPVGADGKVVVLSQATGAVQVVVDVQGYVLAG